MFYIHNSHKKLTIPIILLALLLLILTVGCADRVFNFSDNWSFYFNETVRGIQHDNPLDRSHVTFFCGNYNMFVVDRGIVHFTFEFPADYLIIGFYSDYRLTRISFEGRSNWKPNSKQPPYILMYAVPTSTKMPDVKAMADGYQTMETHYKQSDLIERFTVVVDGMQGEGRVISFLPYSADGPPVVEREVFFGNKEILWRIAVIMAQKGRKLTSHSLIKC